jgi:hypothetical protein
VTDRMDNLKADIGKVQRKALIVGVIAAAATVYGALTNAPQFYQSYLMGYVYWFALAGGSLGLLLLHHLVSGRWGFVIQRPLEAGVRTLPLMALLFVPLLFGMHDLYEWTHKDVVAHDHVLQQKAAYLNEPFFMARTAGYFFIWIVLGTLLTRWSCKQDETQDEHLTGRIRRLAGPGLILYGLTVSFASFDWLMSLDPHWFSTIYGALFIVGQGLATLSFMALLNHFLVKEKPLSQVVTPQQFHDVGNLMFAFTILWAYMSIGQYIIIWSGNLPEETEWFLARTLGTWPWVAMLLAVLHFGVPFFLLLMKSNKRRSNVLARIAVLILVMRVVDFYWLIAPRFHEEGVALHWLDFAAPVAIGGIWLGAFLGFLRKHALLPLHEPRFKHILPGSDVVVHGHEA